MFRGVVLFCFIFGSSLLSVYGQQPEPRGRFMEDSLKIGQPIRYSLSIEYSQEIDIVFPDSLFNFSPFELDHKEYFPTRTKAGISYDSAVYYLVSFEIDTVQTLSLPVFRLTRNDSLLLRPQPDTIFLQQLVTEIPDSVAVESMPLRENTDYLRVDYQFNYPYFLIGLTILLIAVAAVIIFFGKTITNNIKAYRLRKRHERFILSFEQLTGSKSDSVRDHAEKVIIHWKNYLEQLEPFPYRTLTTRELLTTEHAPELEDAMHAIDRAIYSPAVNELPQSSYEQLKQFAEDRFMLQLNKLNHG